MKNVEKLSRAVSSTPNRSGTLAAIGAALSSASGYMVGIDWDISRIDLMEAYAWLVSLVTIFGIGTKAIHEANKIVEPIKDPISSLPRGIRNRNPGNIRIDSRWEWKGQVGQDKDGFVIFDTDVMGIRALAIDLRTKQRKHNLNTIDQIMRRYAPDNENDTDAYIHFISKQLNHQRHLRIDLESDRVLEKMIKGIVRFENGQQPYSSEIINESIKLV